MRSAVIVIGVTVLVAVVALVFLNMAAGPVEPFIPPPSTGSPVATPTPSFLEGFTPTYPGPTPGGSLVFTPGPTPSGPPPTPVPAFALLGSNLLPAPKDSAPFKLELYVGQSVRFILRDGSSRTVTLKGTRLVFEYKGLAVATAATVEVSGSGLKAESAEIMAAGLSAPAVLNGVRVYVDMTKEMNDGRLRDGGGPTKDARLLLSDAKYTLVNDSQYRWPFQGLIWQSGYNNTYWQALQGEPDSAYHHGGIDVGMPPETPVLTWTAGITKGEDRGFDWVATLRPASGSVPDALRQALHLRQVDPNMRDKLQPAGVFIAPSGAANWYHTHLSFGFEWGPLLAEWYIADAGPVELSYIKDWLVAGPYGNADNNTRLSEDYLGGESNVNPTKDAPAPGDRVWKFWDNLAPGVVMVAETVDPYPNSGWAWVNGNYPTSAAYLSTYIQSSEVRQVVLRVGASDAVKVWLGDTEVLNQDTCVTTTGEDLPGGKPSILIDQYKVPVTLEPGWNRLLVKTAQKDGCPKSWQLSVRIADETGEPISGIRLSPVQDDAAPLLDFSQISGAEPALVPAPTTTPTPQPSPTSTPAAAGQPVSSPTPTPTPAFYPVVQPTPAPSPTPTPGFTPVPTLAPQTGANGLQWLRVVGNRIVDESGQTVVLRGVNIENWNWEWAYNHTVAYEVKAIPVVAGAPPNGWGANVVLLAIASGPINRNEEDYIRALDQMVSTARANGAYVMLVYREPEPNLGQSDMPDQAAEDALATLAARYSAEPAVLYGLQVEPHDVTWSQLKPRFQSMIDAIRVRNPRALIAVPGTQWGRHIYHALTDPVDRTNIVYKTHPYDSWDTIQSVYQLTEVSAIYPVILGEFGAGSSMSLSDVINLLDFAEAHGISWIGWLFHEVGCPCMLASKEDFTPTEYGLEIKGRLQAAAGRTAPTPTPAPVATSTPIPSSMSGPGRSLTMAPTSALVNDGAKRSG